MRRLSYIIIFSLAFFPAIGLWAQQRTVDEVKKSIGELSVDLKAFEKAVEKIKPALTNDATRDKAETWWVAMRAQYGLYSKYLVNKELGNKVDVKAMGHALLDGYDCGVQAMKLDTLWSKNKDGSLKLDKKGAPRYKTKFSRDIRNKIYDNLVDYSVAGAELYGVKDYSGAYKAWEIYNTLATSSYARQRHKIEPDTVLGMTRFFQGLAAVQLKKGQDAHRLFSIARNLGYDKKRVYDNDIAVLMGMGDTTSAVQVTREAFRKYGKQDIQYMRILINDCIAKQNFGEATRLLDFAILTDSTNDAYFDLKGNIIELQTGYLDARPFYARAVELNDSSAQAQFDLGRCYYLEALYYMRNNTLKRAAKLLKEVTPTFNKALAHLQKSYALDPRNPDTRNILRDIYYKLGDAENLEKIESVK